MPTSPPAHPSDSRRRLRSSPAAWILVAALALAASPGPSRSADGTWTPFPIAPSNPDTPRHRHGHSMVLDAAGQRLVVFGGFRSAFNTPLGDTWTAPMGATPVFDSLALASGPGPRFGHGAVYDPPRQRMLIFDGVTSPSAGMDVWSLSLGLTPAWSPVAASGAPGTRRQGCGAAYDPVRDRMLVFGGHDGAAFRNEVLVFTPGPPASWSVLGTTGVPPSARNYAGVVYDPVRDRLLVFGGNSGPALRDVHALDLSASPPAWSEISPAAPLPAPRLAASVAYDPVADRLLVFGGVQAPATYYGDLWALSLSGSPTWSALAAPGAPSPRHSAAAVWDPAASRLLLYGGESVGYSRDDLWQYSPGGSPEWTQIGGTGTVPGERIPPGAYGLAFARDPVRNRMLVTGGAPYLANAFTGSVYELQLGNSSGWSSLFFLGTSPGANLGGSMSFDPARDRMLVFGGHTSATGWSNATRALNLSGTPTWSALATVGAPTPRNYHVGVVDASRDRLVVFGGNAAGTPLNDLWWLDLATSEWHAVTGLPASPSPRLAPGAALDPAGDRLLVFGGVGSSGELGDVWALDLASLGWTAIPAAGGPGPRHSPGVTFDPSRRRLLVHGGYDGTQSRDDLWELSLGPAPAWRLLSATGSCPTRHGSSEIYDPIADRLVVWGGFASQGNVGRNDTWQFLPDDHPTAALATLAEVHAEPGCVRLVWQRSGSGHAPATLERGEGDGSWRALGTGAFAGDGRLSFEDRSVRAGTRYAYRLAYEDEGAAVRSATVWVDVPAGLELALGGFRPNPGPREPVVSFTIPRPGPASVEVLDIAGRRAAHREFPGLEAGSHRLALTGVALAPGVYVVRLTFAGEVRTARGAVIR